jgi:D-aspartate ligase
MPIADRLSVLIPDVDAWAGLMVARCLAASGRIVVHGFAGRAAPVLRHSHRFASFKEHNGRFEVDAWLSEIGDIVGELGIDVVLPISHIATRTLIEHRHKLGWANKLPPAPDLSAFDRATNKASLADFLAVHGLPHPRTVAVTTGVPIDIDPSALDFPVVAKPSHMSAGDGVGLCDSPDELAGYLAKEVPGQRWVVQSFIDGYDLAVNTLCRDGRILAATVQHTLNTPANPFRAATGIEIKDDPPALQLAERLLQALGWSGVASIDMRFDTRRQALVILEVNGRYWNSLLGSLNAGVNFPLLTCEMTLGELHSNLTPHAARYFSDRSSMLLSLIGGGRFRIRPHETNLRYTAHEPLHVTLRLAKNAADGLRSRKSGFAK